MSSVSIEISYQVPSRTKSNFSYKDLSVQYSLVDRKHLWWTKGIYGPNEFQTRILSQYRAQTNTPHNTPNSKLSHSKALKLLKLL